MTPDHDEELSAVDKDALERALQQLRRSKDPGRRRQIEDKFAEEGWYKAAHFASYSLQIDNLRLKPWSDPPCYGHLRDDLAAYALAQRLEAAGLSIFEPDPAAALARLEAPVPGELPPAA